MSKKFKTEKLNMYLFAPTVRCLVNVSCVKSNKFKLDKYFSKNGQQDILSKKHNVKYISDIKNKVAFTLAEILITLGIIGVVVAMTLPVVISDYNKKVTATRLKKLYTTLSQAIILSEADNGEHKYWEYGDSNHHRQADIMEAWWNKYLKDYIPNDMIKQVITGKTSVSGGDSYTVILKDGSAIEIEALPGDYVRFLLHTRYKNSNERIYGKDSFLIFLRNSKFNLYAYPEDSINNLIEKCKTPSSLGRACLELIMRNGWEIPDNYPVKF